MRWGGETGEEGFGERLKAPMRTFDFVVSMAPVNVEAQLLLIC
jgi:hypothetical protein